MELSPKENEAALAAAAGGPVANPNPPAPAQDVVHEPTPAEAKYLDAMGKVMGMTQTKESEAVAKYSRGSHLIRVDCLAWDTSLTTERSQSKSRAATSPVDFGGLR